MDDLNCVELAILGQTLAVGLSVVILAVMAFAISKGRR